MLIIIGRNLYLIVRSPYTIIVGRLQTLQAVIDVETCVDDQVVIDKILLHFERKGDLPSTPDTLAEIRALPPVS